MNIAGRSPTKILTAVLHKPNHVAARNMMKDCEHPSAFLGRYLLGTGEYPANITVKTPVGPLSLTAWTHDDVLTINEIFFRGDYQADEEDRVIVDFGSNIGISAAYFLTRGSRSRTYLFEPLPQNIERLKHNLSRFEGRFQLEEVAVGITDGLVEFGWEPTGRYGGVGQKTGSYMTVPCRDSNDVLAEIVERHGRIDILKVDIETLEEAVTRRIPRELAEHLGKVYVEYRFRSNPLEATHRMVQYGSVARFFNRELGEAAAGFPTRRPV